MFDIRFRFKTERDQVYLGTIPLLKLSKCTIMAGFGDIRFLETFAVSGYAGNPYRLMQFIGRTPEEMKNL
ncbi:MAG: hypothetical protein ACLU4J_11685 [Butyricimonas paravirosa]